MSKPVDIESRRGQAYIGSVRGEQRAQRLSSRPGGEEWELWGEDGLYGDSGLIGIQHANSETVRLVGKSLKNFGDRGTEEKRDREPQRSLLSFRAMNLTHSLFSKACSIHGPVRFSD